MTNKNSQKEYRFSQHASKRLNEAGRSQIELVWIERTLNNPDYVEKNSKNNTMKAWKRIPEYRNRALRVVYNPNKNPVVIVTVFFDRGFDKIEDLKK